MENLLLWGFYILTFYAFLPGLVSRIFGFRVFKKGIASQEIALTFDDGPDPVYTARLLDLLASHEAKATFFVVGANAEQHPELLRRMKDEGHAIGIHNYVHKSNWLMRPRAVRKQIHRTSEIIRQATGIQSQFYRPPWGIVNLFDFSNLGYLKIILWSAMFGDWRKRVGVKRLTARLMKKLRPGEVLLLHDRGTTLGADADAPEHMLAALAVYLEAGRKRGYRFVTIGEMIELTDQARLTRQAHKASMTGKRRQLLGVGKRVLVALWLLWEKLFHKLFHLKPVPKGIFHYRILTHRGAPLELGEDGAIQPGDRIAELHFDNRQLFELMLRARSTVQMGIMVIREVQRSLPHLAATLAADEKATGIKGCYGISMINRGSEGFGFVVSPLPQGLFSRLTASYLKLLLKVLHPEGSKRVREKHNLAPKIICMSARMLRTRWGDPALKTETVTPAPSALLLRQQAVEHKNSKMYEAGNSKTAREMLP